MNTRALILWLAAALTVIGLTTNPLYLLLVLLAAALVFVACREPGPLAGVYRLFFVGGMALWLGYIVFSVVTVGGARGTTVLWRLPELQLPALLGGVTLGGPITAEDLAWGAVRGLRIWALLAVFGTFNALVAHYRLLRLAPRSLFHAGLAVTIGVAFVPQTVRAMREIVEAQRVRGHRFRGLRSFAALVAPLLAGSLERSIQLAEALDARGYGRTRPDDRAVTARQVAVLAGLLALAGGIFTWLYYGAALAVPALGGGALGLGLLAWGMWRLGRAVTRSVYRRERWRRRDTLTALAAALAAGGWIACWALGLGGLRYNPYPAITLPPFAALAGLLPLLLAAPALLAAPPERARRSRPVRRTREAPPARPAIEPGYGAAIERRPAGRERA